MPVRDITNEVVKRGKSRGRLFVSKPLEPPEEANLREHFEQRTKSRQENPLPSYQPSSNGSLSFETYERIPHDLRESLEKDRFLPSRKAVAKRPSYKWAEVLAHFRYLQEQENSSLSGLQRMEVPDPRPQTVSPNGTSKRSSPNVLAIQGTAYAARVGAADTTRTAALIPPKPASVIQLQSRRVKELPQDDGGLHAGFTQEPAFRSFKTSIGTDSASVVDLQQTLREFHPSMYSKFFDQVRDVLELDRRVAQTMGRRKYYEITNPEHARIIDDVCGYNYGIFAYAEMGARIGRIARRGPSPSARSIKNGLVKLRPMYMGVLTDMSHHRFLLWRVGKTWDLLEVRFEDILDWVDGLAAGDYVPLTTHHIPLGNYKNPACSDLSRRDQDIVKFMLEAAENLRQGVRGVREKKAAAGAPPRGAQRSTQSPSSTSQTLGYRPENSWLVPITIADGQVDTTLDEDFFTSPEDKKPHPVRPFYRRPRGSAPDAPRTEFVSGHVRGGHGAFAEMKLLSVVTVRRR